MIISLQVALVSLLFLPISSLAPFKRFGGFLLICPWGSVELLVLPLGLCNKSGFTDKSRDQTWGWNVGFLVMLL